MVDHAFERMITINSGADFGDDGSASVDDAELDREEITMTVTDETGVWDIITSLITLLAVLFVIFYLIRWAIRKTTLHVPSGQQWVVKGWSGALKVRGAGTYYLWLPCLNTVKGKLLIIPQEVDIPPIPVKISKTVYGQIHYKIKYCVTDALTVYKEFSGGKMKPRIQTAFANIVKSSFIFSGHEEAHLTEDDKERIIADRIKNQIVGYEESFGVRILVDYLENGLPSVHKNVPMTKEEYDYIIDRQNLHQRLRNGLIDDFKTINELFPALAQPINGLTPKEAIEVRLRLLRDLNTLYKKENNGRRNRGGDQEIVSIDEMLGLK
jgi:hypothetical protein